MARRRKWKDISGGAPPTIAFAFAMAMACGNSDSSGFDGAPNGVNVDGGTNTDGGTNPDGGTDPVFPVDVVGRVLITDLRFQGGV